jgi:hypothetical protein
MACFSPPRGGLAGRGVFEALNHALLMIDRARNGRAASPRGTDWRGTLRDRRKGQR